MLHSEIIVFFIFSYKQKAPAFAEIRRMWAFDHIKRYNLFPLFSQIGQHGAAQAHRCSETNSSPGTHTFLLLLVGIASQPLPRFQQRSSNHNEAGDARIQSAFPGVYLVFIWCLLLFGVTVSRSDLSPENGLNTGVIITCSQRQKHIKPFGRHSKTACRGFKSFCPCQTQKSEKRLEQAIFRTFLLLFSLENLMARGLKTPF